MALSATFAADFSTFTNACAKAEVSLKGIETGASAVESKLTRMGDSLSGTKIIQQAALMAEAVERVGGVSTLTANELQRVGAMASEAAEKLRVLGQDVPPGIQKIADAAKAAELALDSTTKNSKTGFESLIGSVKEMAGALGLAFGAGAVIAGAKQLIGSAIDMASAIGDTATKLGVSAEKLQGWNFAAEQAGATADDISTAVGKLNANLDGGSKSTVSALQAAGLEFSTIRGMKPEDAFETIATAIAAIPDPMTQARVAMELFGKGGQTLLPALKDNFVQVGASATKMSDETVKSLKAAGDAWKAFGNSITIITGTALAATADLIQKSTSSWKNFTLFLTEAAAGGVGFAISQQNIRTEVLNTNRDIELTSPPAAAAIHKTAEELAAEAEAAKKAKAANQEFAGLLVEAQLKKFEEGITGIQTAYKKLIEEEKAATKATEENYTTAKRLTDDYTVAAERASGNLLRAKLADNNRWFEDEFDKLLKSKGDYASYYAALDALRARKAQKDQQANDEEQARETQARNANTVLWDTYFVDLAKLHKSKVMDAELQQVQDGLQQQLDALDRSKPDWESQYDALVAIAGVRQAQIAQNYHDKALQPMIDDGVKLFDAALKGWDSFKTALEGVWQQILHSFEEKLVTAMVDAWLSGLAKMVTAWETAGLLKIGASILKFFGLGGPGKSDNQQFNVGPGPGDQGDVQNPGIPPDANYPPDFVGPIPPSPFPPPFTGPLPPIEVGGNKAPPRTSSTGGVVTTNGIEYLQGGGPVWTPQGSDTVPAMLTPGERVLSIAEARRYRGGNGGGTVIVMLDGRVLAQAIVPEFEGAVRRLGFAR
jgi:hypothetical protein